MGFMHDLNSCHSYSNPFIETEMYNLYAFIMESHSI